MKKELEKALNSIGGITFYDDGNKPLSEHHIINQDLKVIRKALTPPTADEVCEALSEYLKDEVIFKDDLFQYKKYKHYKIMTKDTDIDYCINDLPLGLITMIGRFYESLESENNAK